MYWLMTPAMKPPARTTSAFVVVLPSPVAVGSESAEPALPERPSGAFCVKMGTPLGDCGVRSPDVDGESLAQRGSPNGCAR